MTNARRRIFVKCMSDLSYLPRPREYKKYILEKSNRVQFSTTIDIHTREILQKLRWLFPKSKNDTLPSGAGVVVDYAVAVLNLLLEKKSVSLEEIPWLAEQKKQK